jgi:hypothetical protein
MAEHKHLSPAAAKRLDAASDLGTAEWFRCLAQIRPAAPTKELLTLLHAVLMEITYVALHLDDLDVKDDIRAILHRIAMVGLVSNY